MKNAKKDDKSGEYNHCHTFIFRIKIKFNVYYMNDYDMVEFRSDE